MLGFNTTDEHYQLLTEFINDAVILDLTNKVVSTTIEIRKNYKVKLPDAIIAATAIVNDLILVTRNLSDFKSIRETVLINPYFFN